MKKIFLFVFITLFLILAYFGYPIIKSRYFSSEKKSISVNSDIQKDSNQSISKEIKEVTFNSESLKMTISPKDCDNECFNFKEEEFKYCQSICGLSQIETSDNCDSKTEMQKEYCLKDLGISRMDFKICEQIQDTGIKKACKNRIAEDIMENQTKSEN